MTRKLLDPCCDPGDFVHINTGWLDADDILAPCRCWISASTSVSKEHTVPLGQNLYFKPKGFTQAGRFCYHPLGCLAIGMKQCGCPRDDLNRIRHQSVTIDRLVGHAAHVSLNVFWTLDASEALVKDKGGDFGCSMQRCVQDLRLRGVD